MNEIQARLFPEYSGRMRLRKLRDNMITLHCKPGSMSITRQNLPHPEIVLAQARHETGNFTSRLCRVNHNLFGIKHNGKYAKYSNWKASIKDYKERISSRYTGGDYYAFLRRIKYASDVKYCERIRNIVRTSK